MSTNTLRPEDYLNAAKEAAQKVSVHPTEDNIVALQQAVRLFFFCFYEAALLVGGLSERMIVRIREALDVCLSAMPVAKASKISVSVRDQINRYLGYCAILEHQGLDQLVSVIDQEYYQLSEASDKKRFRK